jgi:hypothetical protein
MKMKNNGRRIGASAIALLILTPLAVRPARAAAVDPACKPVLDSMAKQYSTPVHLYMTQVVDLRGSKPRSSESIFDGGTIYVQVRGKWTRSSMSLEGMRRQHEENIRNAKSMSCRYLRDEAVDGEAAAVYSSRSETEDAKSSSTLWVSKRTGLPLKIEIDIDSGGTLGKQHNSVRYDYSNVRPPAGVK